MPQGKTPSLAEQLSSLSPEDAASLLGVLQVKADQTANKPRPVYRELADDEEALTQVVTPGSPWAQTLIVKGRNPVYSQAKACLEAKAEYDKQQAIKAAQPAAKTPQSLVAPRVPNPLLDQDNGLSQLVSGELS